jgi:uncharacterized protein HemX
MHFSEDDLRAALRRKKPSTGFTQRVMSRLDEPRTQAAPAAAGTGLGNGFLAHFWSPQLRWVTAAALATVLLIAVGVVSYRHQQALEQARGEQARQQVVLALRITQSKLNKVFQRAQSATEHDSKIRRNNL